MTTISFHKWHSRRGFTLAESVVALGIGAVAIVGGITLSQHEMRMVKSVRESNAASHALEERVEQLRLVNWRQMTDPEHLTEYYFPKRPASGRALSDVTERVSVTAYPDPAACAPLIIETDKYGTPSIVSAGTGFATQRLARVNVRVNWTGKDGKSRVRELASIISNAGINSTSLPGMGTDGTSSSGTIDPGTGGSTGTGETTGGTTGGSTGGTTGGSTGDTTGGSTGGSTGGTTGGSTGGTTGGTTGGSTGGSTGGTTTPPTEPTNGNGRGNAGGKSGKK